MEELEEKDLVSFLQTLPESILQQLFTCPWSCICIFRALSDICKHMLLRVLSLEDAFTSTELMPWMKVKQRIELKQAFTTATSLHILSNIQGSSKVTVSPSFRSNLLAQIQAAGEMVPWRDHSKKKQRLEILDVGELNAYAVNRWENILYFIVGSQERPPPSGHIVNLLLEMKLIQMSPGNSRYSVTNKGYVFLLKPTLAQLWYLIRNYIANTSAEIATEILQMMFRFTLCLPGHPYLASMLTEQQQILLSDFMEFGLLYKDQNSEFFYPTFLATKILLTACASSTTSLNLQFSNSAEIEEKKDLEVIVETNFKCYVYSTSNLHVEMLKLFLDIECVLPNLIVGSISRRSVKNAFAKNIKAANLIYFLEANAHKLCLEKPRLVPDNVTDQIILWEMERDRISHKAGVLYEEFVSDEEFQKAVDFTLKKHIHQWSNAESKRLFVLEEHHSLMRDFFKSIKAL